MSAPGEHLSSDAPWDELSAAQAGLEEARRAHARATDARALAVWRARRAGATLGALAHLLGMARKNVLALERRGAEVAIANGAYARDLVRRRLAVVTSGEGLSSDAPGDEVEPEAPACRRTGCTDPPAPGHRFCLSHQWQ